MTLTEMSERRAQIVADAESILNRAEAESRALNEEEVQRYDTLFAEAKSLRDTIERRQRLTDEERSLEISTGRRVETTRVPTSDTLRSFLTGAERELDFDLRALSFAATEGGELVPDGFVPRIERGMKAFGGVREVASILRTDSGIDLPWPTSDDTGNKGVLVTPNQLRTELDAAFSFKTLKAYSFSSGIIRVPFELIEDAGVDIEGELGDMLGERLGRVLAEHYATGTGTDQPEGIATAAAAGPTQTTLGAVTYDELTEILHSVDPAHRANARWLFNDQTLKALRQLKDNDGNPLFTRGSMADGAPETILGKPYTIVQELDDLDEASGRAIIFGDLKKLKVREVRSIRLQKLSERYAEYGQVALLGHMRADSRLIDPGARAVKAFVNAAS